MKKIKFTAEEALVMLQESNINKFVGIDIDGNYVTTRKTYDKKNFENAFRKGIVSIDPVTKIVTWDTTKM